MNVLQGIPPQEVTVADSGILRMCSWLGIALVALDGVRTRDQLRTLVHRIAVLGVAMAALGLVQFVTGDPVVDRLSLPGFVVSGEFASVQTRAGFSRAAGTAAHPLEYAVVLSATLPLAIAAVLPRFARRPLRSLIPPVAIVAALMVSVSRSALIGLAVGVLLILPSLPPRARIMAMLSGAGVTVAIAFTVPGMLGTIRGLVFGALNDPSTKSRSASLLPALHIASRDLLVGRGFGTFLPNNLILDNQFLLVLIELGLLGLFALGLVVLAAMVEGFRPLRCRNDPEARLIGAALAAGIGANVTLLFFFDGLAFIMPGGFLFLYIGLAGTLSALPASDTAIPPQAAAPAQR
ncbi:O-antigen ligase family protein [Raineyella antarctica]|uniref:O-antigen ligase family protein n=1 Tax=Raineyella antarctica TaxID=1577474 RepID=UPI001114CE75|nr:O-antigen ligase family protein [Raineyella antarctica]